jgi:HAMP domain-containing protein
MTDRTATPFIHPDGRIKTTTGTIVAIVVVTAAGVAAWTWARADIRSLEGEATSTRVELKAIDVRVRSLEAAQTDIAVMKNDVQWIRRTIEQQQKTR